MIGADDDGIPAGATNAPSICAACLRERAARDPGDRPVGPYRPLSWYLVWVHEAELRFVPALRVYHDPASPTEIAVRDLGRETEAAYLVRFVDPVTRLDRSGTRPDRSEFPHPGHVCVGTFTTDELGHVVPFWPDHGPRSW